MKILSAEQSRAADQHTIENEPIASIDLMERAVGEVSEWFQQEFEPSVKVAIFCGPGNNGGDGLTLARLLHEEGWSIDVFLCTDNGSADFNTNLVRLPSGLNKKSAFDFSSDSYEADIIVDAIFGSGLNRILDGQYHSLILELNKALALKIAIDIPSGLFADDNSKNDLPRIYKADYTLTFQHPKLALLTVPGTELAGRIVVLDIGLDPQFYQKQNSDYYFLEDQDIRVFYRERAKHAYKGSYGHTFHLCGSEEKMGAAIIAAEASLRAGVGLVTSSIPKSGYTAFNSRLPEAMLEDRTSFKNQSLGRFQSLLIGPGLGSGKESVHLLKQCIQDYGGPIVLDADALRIIAENRTWLSFLPEGVILTPHFGELKALLGRKNLGLDYLDASIEFARKHRLYMVVKNSISALISPSGKVYFSDFGDPALAKGGSGDLLAGLIAGFRAMSYAPFPAMALACFVQGRAARMAAEASHAHSVLSSDILKYIGLAYSQLEP